MSSNQLTSQIESRTYNSIESRALELLGQNVSQTHVAAALGVSDGYISQLLSEPDFASRVAELKYSALLKHNSLDSLVEETELAALQKLKASLDLIYKPMELARIYSVLNAAKRRGSSTPEAITQRAETVSLTIPVQIINHFTTNSANQVVKAGEQELVTVQSARMDQLLVQSRVGALLEHKTLEMEERIHSNERPTDFRTEESNASS